MDKGGSAATLPPLFVSGYSKKEFNFRPRCNIPERADIHSVASGGKETMEIE
jgi:hypothetical protein